MSTKLIAINSGPEFINLMMALEQRIEYLSECIQKAENEDEAKPIRDAMMLSHETLTKVKLA